MISPKKINNPNAFYLDWAREFIGGHIKSHKVPGSNINSVYVIESGAKKFYLKIGLNLEAEKQRLDWLKGKLPIPEVIGFTAEGQNEALLMSAIEGENLASLAKSWDPQKVVTKLASALHKFHSTDAEGFPYGGSVPGSILLHGDACLPNFIYVGNDLSGYVDLGDCEVGDLEIDLSAAVWTLQYNFGSGYGLKFLQEYGVLNPTEELVEKLRLRYESGI